MGLDRIGSARVMMLLTSRPDGEPPLAAHPHITRLTLNRLSRPAVEAITARVAGVRRLSAQLLAEIPARTDGGPLFVGELTKAVVEMSQSQQRRGTAAMSSVGDVPATLHDADGTARPGAGGQARRPAGGLHRPRVRLPHAALCRRPAGGETAERARASVRR